MQELVTPETLDEMDRRVYDFAIQQMPLAELAVKLGVPVSQAQERLERVYSRLGVSNRMGLRELAANPRPVAASLPGGDSADDEYVIGAEPAEAAARTFDRRKFLGTAAAVGVIAVSGAGALMFGGRRKSEEAGDEPAAPGNAILGDGPSSVGQEAKPFPLTPIAGDTASFVTDSWSQGERIDWSHGIFFMRTGDGQVTGYKFNPLGGNQVEWGEYQCLADGQVFAATNSNNTNTSMLVHRSRVARAWSWDSREYRLLEAFGLDPTLLLFESVNVRRTFHFVRLDEEGATEFASYDAESPAGPGPQVIRQGPLVGVFHGPPETPEVAVFNLRTGQEEGRVAINPHAQAKDVYVAQPFQRLKEGFLARWMTPTNGRGELPQRFYSAMFNWQGVQQGPIREDPPDTFYAPNGLWTATVTGWRDGYRGGDTGQFQDYDWHSVEVRYGSIDPAFRIRSATMSFGDDLPPNRWLPELDGFVVAIRGGGPVPIRYALSRGGEPLVVLLSPPQPQFRQWFHDPWTQGAVPHPTNRALISIGRLNLHNWMTGDMFSANVQDGPDHLDPWSAGTNEMVFALPHRGHDISGPPVLLAPKFEQPPFDDAFNFVVEVDPTGLNLRADATASATSLKVMQNGDRLTLFTSADPALSNAHRSVREMDGVRWFYVRAEDGLEGWVNSTWLAWAP